MQRLVTNILENSIKYTESGGSVTVSVEADKKFIHIQFVDTGIGIPEAEVLKYSKDSIVATGADQSPGSVSG